MTNQPMSDDELKAIKARIAERKALDTWDGYDDPEIDLEACIAEIERLRAENARLRETDETMKSTSSASGTPFRVGQIVRVKAEFVDKIPVGAVNAYLGATFTIDAIHGDNAKLSGADNMNRGAKGGLPLEWLEAVD